MIRLSKYNLKFTSRLIPTLFFIGTILVGTVVILMDFLPLIIVYLVLVTISFLLPNNPLLLLKLKDLYFDTSNYQFIIRDISGDDISKFKISEVSNYSIKNNMSYIIVNNKKIYSIIDPNQLFQVIKTLDKKGKCN